MAFEWIDAVAEFQKFFPQVALDVYDMFALWRELGGEVLSIRFYVPPPMTTDPVANRMSFDMWIRQRGEQPKRYGGHIPTEIINSGAILHFKLGKMDFFFQCKGEASDWQQLVNNNPYIDVQVSDFYTPKPYPVFDRKENKWQS